MSRAFDWPALMAAGMRSLGLKPCDFWALTPAELAFLLGAEAGRAGIDRARFEALTMKFPDAGEGEDVR